MGTDHTDGTPAGWTRSCLGAVGDWFSGGTPSKARADYWAGTIPWVSPKDMKRFVLDDVEDHVSDAAVTAGTRTVPAGAVFIVVRGMILAHTFPVCIAGRTMAFNQDVKAIVANGSADGRFVAHWLNGRSDALLGMVTEATHGTKRLEQSELQAFVIDLPPLQEQREIAAILDTVDDAILKTNAILSKLREVKRALLYDLLTRGIDDNGELRDRGRPQLFKDSPLGRIPKVWAVGGLADVGSNERQPILTGPFGAQLGSADFVAEGTPVLRIGNVQWGYLDLSDLSHVTTEKANSLARFRICEGDLLFARQGATTGRNALADARAEGFLINYHIIRVAFDRAKCDPSFMYAVFNSPIVQDQVDREKGRSTREGVSTKTLTSFLLPLPERQEQQRIATILRGHDIRVEAEKAHLRKLELLKKGLTEDLLAGRARVSNPGGSKT